MSCIAAVRQHDSLRKQGTTVAAVGGIRALNYFVLITVQHTRVCVCVCAYNDENYYSVRLGVWKENAYTRIHGANV